MTKQFFILYLFILTSTPAFAGWMANADFSSCPRKYIPNSTGSEGPFNSESDCLSRVNQVKREMTLDCARYSCVNQAGTTNDATPAAAGHQLDKNIGDAVSAGISGQISGADAVGLVGLGLMGNALLAPKAVETPQQRADRIAAELWAQEDSKNRAEQARLTEETYQNNQDQNALRFLDSMSAAVTAPIFSKPQGQNFRGKILCKGGEPGLHTCYVFVCGGAYGGDPICCPEGFPKLNECDCNCYPANAEFECKRYAACQHSYKQPEFKAGTP
ncbi:MAG: hypothetical protein SGJ18_03265 [Pseudomonadota bacterium]|nr:hypothetical protein [Pseudomonadota bacterium]